MQREKFLLYFERFHVKIFNRQFVKISKKLKKNVSSYARSKYYFENVDITNIMLTMNVNCNLQIHEKSFASIRLYANLPCVLRTLAT